MKGMCQNMAFTRLFQSSHEITEVLRGKDIEGAKKMLEKVTEDYDIVITGIGKHLIVVAANFIIKLLYCHTFPPEFL